MGAIFFPFALHDEFSRFVAWLTANITESGVALPEYLFGSILFFTAILVFQIGYYFMVTAQCWYAKMDKNLLLPLFGYGFIPMILGGLLASLYATYRVIERAMVGGQVHSKALAIPFSFLFALGTLFVFIV